MYRAFLAAVTAHLLFAFGGTALAAKVAVNIYFAGSNGGGTTNVKLVTTGAPLKGSGHMIAGKTVYPMYVTSGHFQGSYLHLSGTIKGESSQPSFTLTINRMTGIAGWAIPAWGFQKNGKGTVVITR